MQCLEKTVRRSKDLTWHVLKSTAGKYYILELNDTAIGFLTHRWKEDTEHVIELVMQKMNEIYCPGMEVKPNEQKPVESPKKQAQPVETKDTTKEGKKDKDKKKDKKEKEKKK
jgi:outer membrane biosynthesis protein TonB